MIENGTKLIALAFSKRIEGDRTAGFPLTRKNIMLWGIVAILVVLWVLGFGVFHVAGGLIHLLLVVAAIVIVFRLVTGRSAV